MRHDWMDDILAVIDAGSFARAAEIRNITQSAFTRRIEAIETHLGGPIFDRRRKPVVLRASARGLEPILRAASRQHTALVREAAELATGAGSITLACQHAISATVSPGIVEALAGAGFEPVRIRSGDRDECLVMLLSGVADLVVAYTAADAPFEAGAGLEAVRIGGDQLIPVASPGLHLGSDGRLPVVAYPEEVYFGSLVSALWRELPDGVVIQRRIETALTLAAYRYALEGLAVAWLPRALVEGDLAGGRLRRVEPAGRDLPLDIQMIRLRDSGRELPRSGWDSILAATGPRSERLP